MSVAAALVSKNVMMMFLVHDVTELLSSMTDRTIKMKIESKKLSFSSASTVFKINSHDLAQLRKYCFCLV